MNDSPLIAIALISVAAFLLILTRPSIEDAKHEAILEYRSYLQECLKHPALSIETCDTVWDKSHGWPQGPK